MCPFGMTQRALCALFLNAPLPLFQAAGNPTVVLGKEDMVGSALTELSPVVGVSVVLMKEDMVGSLDRVISCCRCVLDAQEGIYGR